MRTSERRQLKQDRFAETTKETISWAVSHRTALTWVLSAAVVLAAVVLGAWWYWNYHSQQASAALGKAMETYNAPLRAPNTPPAGEEISFAAAVERAQAARTQFDHVARQYSHTKSGRIARYMAALTTIDMGDDKSGEEQLRQVAAAGDRDLSSLAKLALAGIYRNTHRDKEALDLYQDLVSHPTASVSKPMAQLELASFYEATKQNAEAAKLYQEIVKENPGATAASFARQHMQGQK